MATGYLGHLHNIHAQRTLAPSTLAHQGVARISPTHAAHISYVPGSSVLSPTSGQHATPRDPAFTPGDALTSLLATSVMSDNGQMYDDELDILSSTHDIFIYKQKPKVYKVT